jgi:predicted aspartyl protease
VKRAIFSLFFTVSMGLACLAADSPTAAGSVPFKLLRGHLIVVKCSVGGLQEKDLTAITAIIDTGASETVLDIALARRLSLETRPDSATFIVRQARVWAVAIPALELGPLKAERLEGIATDLSSLTAEFGIGPQVLIGMDLLRRTNFVIDYKAHRLIFGSAPALPHSAPLVSAGSNPRLAVIQSTIMGKTLRLQVDSGFEGLLLYRTRLNAPAAFAGSESHIANVAQPLLAHSFDAPDVQIGNWRSRYPQVSVVDSAPPESAAFDGLIGTAFLSSRRVAFDFENQILSWD